MLFVKTYFCGTLESCDIRLVLESLLYGHSHSSKSNYSYYLACFLFENFSSKIFMQSVAMALLMGVGSGGQGSPAPLPKFSYMVQI